MVAVADILRGHAFLLGADGDGHTMLIAAADEDHRLLSQAQVAHVDVGRHIDAGEVADMHAAIGIGQSGGHGGPLEMFFFHVYS